MVATCLAGLSKTPVGWRRCLGQGHRPCSPGGCGRMCNAKREAQGAALHCSGQVTMQAAWEGPLAFKHTCRAWFMVAVLSGVEGAEPALQPRGSPRAGPGTRTGRAAAQLQAAAAPLWSHPHPGSACTPLTSQPQQLSASDQSNQPAWQCCWPQTAVCTCTDVK